MSEKIRKEIMLYNDVIASDYDFEDCDKIFRIESKSEISEKIISYFNEKGLIREELIYVSFKTHS